jgi:sulfur dioxygenase
MERLRCEELNEGAECRSYLLFDPASREAVIIDPLLERVPRYLAKLQREGLRLLLAIDTHLHADHLSGARELARHTGARTAGAPAQAVDLPLREGDALSLGGHHLDVMAIPGHTADALCIRAGDDLFTGDTLLLGTTGRTDLPSGDAEAEYASLQRLLALPNHLRVLPAHDYRGRTTSTIGEERASNPRLQLSREAFIAEMTQPRSSQPARLMEALAFNGRPRDEVGFVQPGEPS